MFDLWKTLIILSEVHVCALRLFGVFVEYGADIIEETMGIFRRFALCCG